MWPHRHINKKPRRREGMREEGEKERDDGVMNYQRLRERSLVLDNGKQVPYHDGITSFRPLGAALQRNSEEREKRENVTGLICHCHPNLTPLHPLSCLRLKESRYIGRQVWVPPITMLALFPARIGQALPAATPTRQLNRPNVQRRVFDILQSGGGFSL